MVHVYKLIILLLISSGLHAQVVQERNARGADRIIILKDGFRVPIRDTATAPALLNYSGDSSRGGVVYDSTLQKLCFWTGARWVCLDDAAGPGGSSQWRDTTNGIYYNAGNVGINTVNPAYSLHVAVGQTKDTTIQKFARAFGTTRLYFGYTGSAIRVRRSSDNAEQDIGFLSSGMLDTVSLKTFVGAGQGHVTTWYDQMGGTSFTQTTAARQPVIVQGGNVQYIGSTPAIRYNVLAMHLNNASMNFSAGQRRDITVKYKIDTLSNFQGVISANGINYRQAVTATAQVFFDGTQRTYTPTFTFTDPVTLRIDSNNATINNSSVSANFAVPNITTGFAIGGWGALETMKGSMTEVSVGPFNFDTTITIITGNAYINDTTITGQAIVRDIASVGDTTANKPIVAGSDGLVKRFDYWPGGGGGGGGLTIDSVAIRRIGIHYVGWNSGFGGAGNNGGTTTTPAVASNIFVGLNSGSQVTSGGYSVALGSQALQNLTTGSYNVAIGFNALQDHTTGLRNVAIGEGAASNNTTGSSNVALGYNALLNNLTGSFNMAIGVSALRDYLGSNNLAVGNSALFNTTGANNIGIGDGAGGGNTTGQRNVFIGEANGITVNTTGSDNVKIGYRTGRDGSTTGSGNTLIGVSAGNSGGTAGAANNTYIGFSTGVNSGESFSTFIGAGAGSNGNAAKHTGTYNIGIGFDAMAQNSATARTGSSNTIIGDRINLPSVTASNQVVFGSNNVNWFTRFTGGGWLFNNTGAAVTTQTTSAALEINGTTGAVLLPRLTTAQRDALTATNGMILYNTTTDKIQAYAGGAWVDLH
jgi:hypothetical protein